MSTPLMLPGEVFTTFVTQNSGNVCYGVRVDERTTVFNLGRAAFVFLGERGTPTQLAAATRACSPDPAARFATVEALHAAWSDR